MAVLRCEQSLFDAAIESARIFNGVASECAVSGQMLSAITDFSTATDVARRMSFHSEKVDSLACLLDVLVDNQLVERGSVYGQTVYRGRPEALSYRSNLDAGLKRYEPDAEILRPWFGDEHVELVRSSNKRLLGEDLSFFRSPLVKIRFDRVYKDAWRSNLLNPLYEFGRVEAVRDLVGSGRYFLDLASGLGYGAQRIAEFCPEGCEVVCVDISSDMLAEAGLLVYPGARIKFIEWDLNRGLPPLPPRPFDGVLFNGSFHFIEQKRACLTQIHAVMRTGGLLVIGHCYCRSGFADEPMHDLYFSLIENPSWVVSFEELRSLLADTGFLERRQFHRGSHSYIVAERSSRLVE